MIKKIKKVKVETIRVPATIQSPNVWVIEREEGEETNRHELKKQKTL